LHNGRISQALTLLGLAFGVVVLAVITCRRLFIFAILAAILGFLIVSDSLALFFLEHFCKLGFSQLYRLVIIRLFAVIIGLAVVASSPFSCFALGALVS